MRPKGPYNADEFFTGGPEMSEDKVDVDAVVENTELHSSTSFCQCGRCRYIRRLAAALKREKQRVEEAEAKLLRLRGDKVMLLYKRRYTAVKAENEKLRNMVVALKVGLEEPLDMKGMIEIVGVAIKEYEALKGGDDAEPKG